jgi:hypothetical protein
MKYSECVVVTVASILSSLPHYDPRLCEVNWRLGPLARVHPFPRCLGFHEGEVERQI